MGAKQKILTPWSKTLPDRLPKNKNLAETNDLSGCGTDVQEGFNKITLRSNHILIRQLYHHNITSTGCRLLQSVLFSYSANRSGNFHYSLIEPLQVQLSVCLHAGSRAGDTDGGVGVTGAV